MFIKAVVQWSISFADICLKTVVFVDGVTRHAIESVNRSLRRRPGFSTILTGSPLCSTASQNLRLVASLMKESFRMAVLSLEMGVL